MQAKSQPWNRVDGACQLFAKNKPSSTERAPLIWRRVIALPIYHAPVNAMRDYAGNEPSLKTKALAAEIAAS
jgi:hypothetical protein